MNPLRPPKPRWDGVEEELQLCECILMLVQMCLPFSFYQLGYDCQQSLHFIYLIYVDSPLFLDTLSHQGTN